MYFMNVYEDLKAKKRWQEMEVQIFLTLNMKAPDYQMQTGKFAWPQRNAK